MGKQEREFRIRRILIALDGSHHSLAALSAAAELASSLEAEIRGLFVEDIDLLRLAELPMARELQLPFATTSEMSPRRMRRQLRAQALRARQALSSMCRQRQIEWSFEVMRGDVSSKVLEEAVDADLLCLGKASRPVMPRSGMGSTARAAATRAPHSVLLISRGARVRPPVVVPYDGSPETLQSLLLAGRLAQETGGFLSILVPARAAAPSEEIKEEITDQLDGGDLVIRYRQLSGSGVMSLIAGVGTEGCGTLVLSRAVLPADDLGTLLEAVDCPVLLVQ